jgi:hypothetical protein
MGWWATENGMEAPLAELEEGGWLIRLAQSLHLFQTVALHTLCPVVFVVFV